MIPAFAPDKESNKLSKYAAFLLCELYSDFEQLTSEEDARTLTLLPVVAMAIKGATRSLGASR